MPQLKFLYGENLEDQNLTSIPGAIYLDVATNELFFGHPQSVNQYIKMIDTDTFLYNIEGTSLSYPSTGVEDANVI